MTLLPSLAQTNLFESWGVLGTILAIIAGVFALIVLVVLVSFFRLWIKCYSSSAHIRYVEFFGMVLRRIPRGMIASFRIKAVNAGIDLPAKRMEELFLASGLDPSSIPTVVSNLIRTHQAGANVTFDDLRQLYLQRGKVDEVADAMIFTTQAGLDVPFSNFMQHHMAGGRVVNVAKALIAATRAKMPLDFADAARIDLAGRDVVDAVQTSVKPKVIDCPDPSRGVPMLDAVAKDGIRLLAKARVTVRTNIARVIGGATQETIIARVGQGIVSAIGSTGTYKDVLENPDSIAKTVLNNSLDSQTAYEIVSIDIADISVASVGDKANVGAYVEAERAETDKIMRQAEAEGRRAMAVAQEQENRAEIQKNRALVTLAEAEIPKAIAESFRSGNLGIMDYYNLRNVQADTQMRNSIAGEAGEEGHRKE